MISSGNIFEVLSTEDDDGTRARSADGKKKSMMHVSIVGLEDEEDENDTHSPKINKKGIVNDPKKNKTSKKKTFPPRN
ncbi:hypothetical protein AGDE_14045 [Angomonas deanei]|uniref:Uncharacterized protein n=1 Tax=Angomonas deanei TaxID=59799 RepID=A0A7G2CTS0_9TRYP|nr:hypothetical protein AGDE_14045 [Angomonas deanei]CAD2222935.1 hypothetical protein, conserved [Angomonas deanei]|eukprot:EPY21522.1 hypothetical protein AGDE_14045 [Angomonas deanei]